MAGGIVIGRGVETMPGDVRGKAAELMATVRDMPDPELAGSPDPDLDFETDMGTGPGLVPAVLPFNIGDQDYELRELVLGQEIQLFELLRASDGDVGTVEIDLVQLITDPGAFIRKLAEGVDIDSLLRILGDKVPRFFAIILTPKGTRVRDKDLAAIEADLMDTMTADQQVDVLMGFFVSVGRTGNRLTKTLQARAKDLKAVSPTGRGKSKAAAGPKGPAMS